MAYEYYTYILTQLPEICYNNRAWCLYQLGYYVEALDDINQVLTINPQNNKAMFRKALCLIKLNNPLEAKLLLNELSKTESEVVGKLVECELMLRVIDPL